MIWESHYWKSSLLRKARYLRLRKKKRRWTDASYAEVEEIMMLGFYSIRKLMDSNKLSSDLNNKSITVKKHPWKGEPVTMLNWHHYEKLYDIASKHEGQTSLRKICNQIVHSYIFATEHSETGGLTGFFFVSDDDRDKHLFQLSVDAVIDIFKIVGNNYPDHIEMEFSPRKKDYKFTATVSD